MVRKKGRVTLANQKLIVHKLSENAMAQWILSRLFEVKDQPKPRFAFQGTVNWMKALSVLVNDQSFSDDAIRQHFEMVQRRPVNSDADAMVFENILMAFHSHASLVRFNEDVTHRYDICRSAIISWYYSIYFCCSAMVTAASGSSQESHTATAKVWNSDIVDNGLAMSPFSLSTSSLVTVFVENEISELRQGNTHDLNVYAETREEAWGAAVSYLKGTAEYEKWRVEERVKGSSEFKKLGVNNFRTKAARELRDKHLEKNKVNFLIQAFRYRGKANYRDSVFLSYGNNQTEKIEEFCKDLREVSEAFQRMAAFYLSKRVERDSWSIFIDDLEENSRLSIGVDHLRV